MLPLRIAFSGASGTGKSTLAKWVSEQYGLPICPVGARSVAAEMGFASPYDADAAGRRPELQIRLMLAKVKWEKERLLSGEGFVTDRTYFDNLAYSMLHCVDAIGIDIIESVVQAMGEAYTYVFFLPVGEFQAIDDDPSRRKEIGYHALYQAALMGLYAMSCTLDTRACRPVHIADLSLRKLFIVREIEKR